MANEEGEKPKPTLMGQVIRLFAPPEIKHDDPPSPTAQGWRGSSKGRRK